MCNILSQLNIDLTSFYKSFAIGNKKKSGMLSPLSSRWQLPVFASYKKLYNEIFDDYTTFFVYAKVINAFIN